MKKVVGLTGIAAAIILGSYFGMGVVTKRTLKENLNVVNASNSVMVKILNYDRGWFTSTATIEWQAHIPQRVMKTTDGETEVIAAQNLEMTIPVVIYHGPVMFVNKSIKFGLGYAQTNLPLPNKFNAQFANTFTADSTKPALSLDVLVNYLNKSTIELKLPSFKLARKQGGQLNWLGMTSETTVTKNADKINGSFELQGAQITKDLTNATIGTISSNYKLHKTNNGLYLGYANVSIPSVAINHAEKKVFELSNLNMESDSDIDNGLFDSHLKLSIDKVFADGKSYGPGKVAISVVNLDAAVLAHINQQAAQAQQGTVLEKQQALLAVLPDVPKLLSKGAKIEVSELRLEMPQGSIDGKLELSLPKNESNNPFELIQKVEGDARLTVPAKIVREILNESNSQKVVKEQAAAAVVANSALPETTTAPTTTITPVSIPVLSDAMAKDANTRTQMQLNTMVQNGLVVNEGDKLSIHLSVSHGKLLVNGKPFDSAMTKF